MYRAYFEDFLGMSAEYGSMLVGDLDLTFPITTTLIASTHLLKVSYGSRALAAFVHHCAYEMKLLTST